MKKNRQSAVADNTGATRSCCRALENYGDEGVLGKFLPMIWMPWWSPEDQRDWQAMESGRQGLREQIFPFLQKTLSGQDYLCGDFSLADAPMMTGPWCWKSTVWTPRPFPRPPNIFSAFASGDSSGPFRPKRAWRKRRISGKNG